MCTWQQGTRGGGEARQEAADKKRDVDSASDLLFFYCSRAEIVRTEATRLLENTKNLEARRQCLSRFFLSFLVLVSLSANRPSGDTLWSRNLPHAGVDRNHAQCAAV